MEQKLKKLFDYQKFEGNHQLEQMLDEANSAYPRELSIDELDLVQAGTGPIMQQPNVDQDLQNIMGNKTMKNDIPW